MGTEQATQLMAGKQVSMADGRTEWGAGLEVMIDQANFLIYIF